MADLSVAQVIKLLAKKRAQLRDLNKRRERLIREIGAIDTRIKEIGGAVPPAERPRRTRPQNERALYDVVIDVLQEHDDGLTLNELAEAVLATGYKTNSVKFANPVYQCVYNASDKIVRDPETRQYRLKAKRQPKSGRASN